MPDVQQQTAGGGSGPEATRSGNGIDVLITLTRKHDKRLSQITSRLDVHDRRFAHLDQRFDEVAYGFRQVSTRFDQADDRFVHVEQRLDFVGGQLTEILRLLGRTGG